MVRRLLGPALGVICFVAAVCGLVLVIAPVLAGRTRERATQPVLPARPWVPVPTSAVTPPARGDLSPSWSPPSTGAAAIPRPRSATGAPRHVPPVPATAVAATAGAVRVLPLPASPPALVVPSIPPPVIPTTGAPVTVASPPARSATVPTIPPLHDPVQESLLFGALMVGPNQGLPHGVPTGWSWAQHAEVDSPSNAGMAAMTAWGQIYAAGPTEPPTGSVRVEIRNIRTLVWVRSKGAWVTVQATPGVQGEHYLENFQGNQSTPADTRTEPDGGTSVSMVPGHNFHFWPTTGRAGVTSGDIGAVITTYDARLIGAAAGSADYVGDVGGDWWRSTSASYSGPNVNNRQIGVGRFLRLSTAWLTIGFYTGGP